MWCLLFCLLIGTLFFHYYLAADLETAKETAPVDENNKEEQKKVVDTVPEVPQEIEKKQVRDLVV